MIRKIIEWIKALLRITEPIDIPDSEIEEMINSSHTGNDEDIESRSHRTATEGDSAQSIVSFLITKTGNIDLNISWDEVDQTTARNLATVLFLINSGAFENNCAELLVQMAQEDPQQMPFVRSIIVEWNNRKAGDPLIKPSEVFQFGTIGTQK